MHERTTTRRLVRGAAGLVLALSLGVGLPAYAAPHFVDAVLSDSKDADEGMDTFATGTPKIYVQAGLEDVADGAKVTGTWIAEKTDAAPPNYKIDAAELTIKGGMNHVDFSLSRPNAGWPTGTYRVELAVDGKVIQQIKFSVQK